MISHALVRAKAMLATLIAAAALAGCAASLANAPINAPLTKSNPATKREDVALGDSFIALTFSGGGTRAAAFSHGVLKALHEEHMRVEGRRVRMTDRLAFISGVSGGSITAAYYGLKGPAALSDFRERFLIKDVQAELRTDPLAPQNIGRVLAGGLNDRSTLAQWLDRNLFDRATFADLERRNKPVIWINATDIYNRAPFVFERETFAALCTDLGKLPLAEAVAASAAVPLIFAPVVIENFAGRCRNKPAPWIAATLKDRSAPQTRKAMANALTAYRTARSQRYIKLLDGGISDNFGLAGLALGASGAGSSAFTPEDAVRLRRVLFLVVNAARDPSGDWSRTVEGPGAEELIMAVSDTAVDSSVRSGYDAFLAGVREMQQQLKTHRCSLSDTEITRVRGSLAGWRCDDVAFVVGQVSYADLDAKTATELGQVPTSLSLPTAVVDRVIVAGGEALRRNREFLAFRADADGGRP